MSHRGNLGYAGDCALVVRMWKSGMEVKSSLDTRGRGFLVTQRNIAVRVVVPKLQAGSISCPDAM